MEKVTRKTIKHRRDFKTQKEFAEYLHGLCGIGLSLSVIISRVNRFQHPYDIITTPKVTRPSNNHPYKRRYPK